MASDQGWTGLDRWITSGDNSHINEQEVKLTDKGKCSAFGETVVGSGRAEWDLQIDFESFGGISIGVYRQDLKHRDNINMLPTEQTFTYTPDGYGYANKTGAFTANKERKKYGIRYRHGDKITVRLDLQAKDLTFLINDESQGIAIDNLPKGAYRLACCMQFKEQKVSILRFWNSIGKNNTVPNVDSTKTRTNKADKKGKDHTSLDPNMTNDDYTASKSVSTKQKAKDLYADYKEPVIDPDADWFGNYDDNDKNNDDDDDDDVYVAESSSDDVYVPAAGSSDDDNDNDINKPALDIKTSSTTLDEDEKKMLADLEKKKPKPHGRTTSIVDVNKDIDAQHRKKLSDQLDKLHNLSDDMDDNQNLNPVSASNHATDAVGLIGGRSRGLSKAEQKIPEPLLIEKIDDDLTDFFNISGSNLTTSRSIVTCTRSTNGSHSAFGQQIVSNGRIEWMLKIDKGHSMRIGVCGTTEYHDCIFTETKYGYGYGDDGNIYFGGSHIEYNDGFKSGDIVGVFLDMNTNTLKFSVNAVDHGLAFDSINLNPSDDINGYRLAVSLQNRSDKITLMDSKVYNVERRSPRPNSNQFNIGSQNGGHQRKLSYTAMQKNQNKITSPIPNKSDDNNNNNVSADDKPKKKKKKPKNNKDKPIKNAKASSGGGAGKNKKGKNKNKNKDKGVKAADKGKKKKINKNDPKSPSKKKKNKKNATNDPKKKKIDKNKKKKKIVKNNDDKKVDDAVKKKKVVKKKTKTINWVKRDNIKDSWDAAGPKLTIEKNTVSTLTNIKDGNSAFGKLKIKQKMKVKWDLTIKSGASISVGVCNISGSLKTPKNKKLLTKFFSSDINGYGYMGADGGIQRSGRYKKYGEPYKTGNKISIMLDMKLKTLSFILNGDDQGIAFKNLPTGDYRLATTLTKKREKIILTKTTIWDVKK